MIEYSFILFMYKYGVDGKCYKLPIGVFDTYESAEKYESYRKQGREEGKFNYYIFRAIKNPEF